MSGMEAISTEDITFTKPEIKEFLVDYNNLMAGILSRNFPTFKYLASATINRLEAQTHFYERVEKYLQIRAQLLADAGLRIRVTKADSYLYAHLNREFGNRIEAESAPRDLLHAKIRFLFFSWPGSLLKTLVFSLLGRFADRPENSYDYIIRTYYDFRCQGPDGRMRDEYFGPFADDLSKNSRVLVVFRHISLNWRTFRHYLRVRRGAPWASCTWESLLPPYTVIKCFIRYLFSRITIREPVVYKGVEITSLLQSSLDEDFYLRRGLNVYLEYEVARKILDFCPRRLFLPFENQTWEKMYPLVRDEVSSATSIAGFQHTGLSYKLLNYFPCQAEKHLPVFPDVLFTVGDIFAKLLGEKAFYPCSIKVGAALRHYRSQHDSAFKVRAKDDKTANRKIVYAFSYDLATYRKIVDVLAEHFGGTDFEVYLRFHPLYPENNVLERLGRELPANFIPAGTLTWEEIYRRTDLVLYDDNSIGLEAMLHGVLTLLLDIEPVYNCDRMFYFDAWQTSVNLSGMVELSDQLLDGRFVNPFDKSIVEEYLQRYYAPYSDSAYTTFLE